MNMMTEKSPSDMIGCGPDVSYKGKELMSDIMRNFEIILKIKQLSESL